MVGISYSRALLTFAFVKQEFEQTGDLLRGFMPLFAPIFSSLGESIFDPREFTSKVESFYGLRMHPYVAEDWIPRFEDAGFIELIEGDRFNKTYRCRSRETTSMMQDASLITEVVNELVEHTDSLLRAHNFELDRTRIEEAIISRLCKPEFINILNRPQRNPINPNRLTLSKGKEEEALRHEDALIDFILADRLLHLFEHNKEHFARVADVAGGALVSEVVLGLRSPPKLGQSAKGTEVFLDSPIIIDLLDLSEKEQCIYASMLINDLKKMGVYLRTFEHNLIEVRGILEWAHKNFGNVRTGTGSVAVRLRTDKMALSRMAAIRHNLTRSFNDLGIQILNMEKTTAANEKFFPQERIVDLTAQIRPYREIYSREVDAKSIAGVARKIFGRSRVASILSLPAIFLTKNSELAEKAIQFIREDYAYDEDAAPPFLTDRQMAGVVWLAQGGAAGSISTSQLLANCTMAIAPRRDVLARVYNFLELVDENSAKEFEALMAEDRCNHYVMSYTLGDAALVTKDNAYRILEDVKRAAIQDTLTEAEDRLKAELEKREESYRLASEAQSQQHEQRLAELELALEQQRAEARRHEMEVAHREAQIEALRSGQEAQKETLENADTAIVELQRSTIIGCIDAASGHERVLKIAIAFSVSIGVAIVGGVGNYLLSALTDRFWIALIILALMALTGTLTFMMTWVVPDLILGSVISKRRQRYFEKELQRRGAADYVAGWTVDWGNRTVARKADATLVSLLGLDSEGRTQPNNCGGQTSDAVLGEPVRDSAPPRPGPVALDTLVRKKKRKRRR